MSRIVPSMPDPKGNLPKWLNQEEIVSAGKEQAQQKQETLTKVASRQPHIVIASYICNTCNKVTNADNKDIRAQANLNARAGDPKKPFICMTCGTELQPYKTLAKMDNQASPRYANQTEKRVDLVKEGGAVSGPNATSDHGITNSFVDRHLQYKAVDTLATFARKAGMMVGRARYLKSERVQSAGQGYPVLNNFQCELEWQINPKLKRRVEATISYDPAGKFVMPKVFKTADGKEFPFEKDVIKRLSVDDSFRKASDPVLKKSDQLKYRKPDPSNFKAIASLNEDSNEVLANKLVDESKKKVPNEQLTKEAIGEQPLVPQLPQAPVAPQMGQAPQQFQPNTQVSNTLDGKVYNVVSQDTTTGITVTDPTTGRQSVVPPNQSQNLKPVVKTTELDPGYPEEEDPLFDNTRDDLSTYSPKRDEKAWMKNYTENPSEYEDEGVPFDNTDPSSNRCPQCGTIATVDEYNKTINEQVCEQCGFHFPSKGFNSSGDSLDAGFGMETSVDAANRFIKEAMNAVEDNTKVKLEDDENKAEQLQKPAVKQYPPSTLKKIAILQTGQKRWHDVRKTIDIRKPTETIDPQTDFSRQTVAARKLGLDPYKGKVDKTGRDTKTGIPMGETKEIEIGMTEFPKDQKRDDSAGNPPYKGEKGYRIPFKKMNENQVKEREHFENENKLPIRNMRRDELADYVKGKDDEKNYGLNSEEDQALRKELGLSDPFVKRAQQPLNKTADENLNQSLDNFPKGYGSNTRCPKCGGVNVNPYLNPGGKAVLNDDGDPYYNCNDCHYHWNFDPNQPGAMDRLTSKTAAGDNVQCPKCHTSGYDPSARQGEKPHYQCPKCKHTFQVTHTRDAGGMGLYDALSRPPEDKKTGEMPLYEHEEESPESKWNSKYHLLKENTKEISPLKKDTLSFRKTAADEPPTGPTKMPIKWNPNAKKAPGSDAYKEPDVIPELKGSVKDIVDLLHKSSEELDALKEQLKTGTQPYEEAINTLHKSMDPQIADAAANVRAAMDMAFDEISATKESVFYFGEKIIAAYPEEASTAPPATVPQIIKEAEGISQELAEQVKKLKAIVENRNTSLILNRFLTEFPVSKGHEKKLGAIDDDMVGQDESSVFDDLLSSLKDFVIGLKQVNIKLLQGM
jgi:hypothetical protein